MLVTERTLVNRIRGIREEQGISQRDMAKHLKINQTSYSRLESGHRFLRYSQLVRIIDFLNLDLRVLSDQSTFLDEHSTPYKNALQLCKANLEHAEEMIRMLREKIELKDQIIANFEVKLKSN